MDKVKTEQWFLREGNKASYILLTFSGVETTSRTWYKVRDLKQNPTILLNWGDKSEEFRVKWDLINGAEYSKQRGTEELAFSSVQFSCSVESDSLQTMDCSTPGLLVYHQLPEFTQTHFHWVGDAIQPSHPLSSPSPPAFKLSQHQGQMKQFFASSGQSIGV